MTRFQASKAFPEPITVLKFGSSVLDADAAFGEALRAVEHEIARGRRVVAVVSAPGRTTEALLARAHEMTATPDPHALALLLSTGEATSVALFALAARREGLAVEMLTPDGLGLRTTGPALDADPEALDRGPLRTALTRAPLVVVPGFVGRSAEGRPTVLGRGGSDLTALVIASAIGAATCRLVKDVDGVYDGDPTAAGPPARRYDRVTFDDALALNAPVVQPKAIRYAQRCGLEFEVGDVTGVRPTVVGFGTTLLAPVAVPAGDPARSPDIA